MEKQCVDCEVKIEQMKLQTGGYGHRIDIVTDKSKGGILGSLGAKEKLAPVPYVCPECRRIQFFAEDQ